MLNLLLTSVLLITSTLSQTSPLSNITVAGNVSTASVPACAITCTISVLPTSDCSSYGVSNLTCLCTSTNFQNQYLTCQTKTCNSVDLTAAEKFGVESCASIGHPITIANNTTPTSSSPSASSASPITTASGTMAPITSATTKPSAGNKKNEVAVGVMGMMILAGVGLIL